MGRIPDDRRYFRIGEASRIIGVKSYVLRYWESEFSEVRPSRAGSKQRTYQKKDLETLLEIKRLLYEEKMTIAGARQRLRQEKTGRAGPDRGLLEEIKRGLREVLESLNP